MRLGQTEMRGQAFLLTLLPNRPCAALPSHIASARFLNGTQLVILSHPLPPSDVRAIVAQYLEWATEGHWQTLFGGRTNAAWRIDGTDGQSAVLKLYRASADNPLFPNDPVAEARMLKHLQGHDIAPDLITTFEAKDAVCNLYHALPGAPWTDGTAAVADLINRLHTIPAPEGLRGVPNGSDALRAQAESILQKAGKPLPAPTGTFDIAPTKTQVLLHGDIVPGNLIRNTDGVRLIDWQCPAIGDACEDLAVFLSPAMQLLYRGAVLSDTERNGFLSCFPPALQDRYAALAPLYHYRMAAYCLWQMSRGQLAYEDALEAELAAF